MKCFASLDSFTTALKEGAVSPAQFEQLLIDDVAYRNAEWRQTGKNVVCTLSGEQNQIELTFAFGPAMQLQLAEAKHNRVQQEGPQMCELLEHRGSIGSLIMQIEESDIDEPTLSIQTQFVAEGATPNVAQICLEGETLLLRRDPSDGRVMMPRIKMLTAEGDISNLKVRIREGSCPKLSLPRGYISKIAVRSNP